MLVKTRTERINGKQTKIECFVFCVLFYRSRLSVHRMCKLQRKPDIMAWLLTLSDVPIPVVCRLKRMKVVEDDTFVTVSWLCV
jgi:hypothetical protein